VSVVREGVAMIRSRRGFPLIALTFVLAQGVWAAETVTIAAERVEIHAEADASSRVLAAVSRGDVLEVLGRESGWIRVATPGTGYAGYIPAVLTKPGGVASSVAPRPAPTPAAPPASAPTPTPARAPTYAPTPPPPPTRRPTPVTTHEEPQPREGFWIGFGAGYGSTAISLSCDGCSSDRAGSFTGFLKLGGTLNPQVLLGVESNAWVKSEDIGFGLTATLTLGALSGTVTVYPVVTSGFFLKGGAGLSYMSTDISVSGVTVNVSKTGWGVIGGVGYDLRVGRNISITPSFNYYYGKPGDISVEGNVILPGWSHNVLDFALGITFH
jgi:Outer membrane protein beta-barrel domain/Bacterial SH3 domain